MNDQEAPGTALEVASLGFVTDEKEETGGFGIFEGHLWDCTKFVKEHLREGVYRETKEVKWTEKSIKGPSFM